MSKLTEKKHYMGYGEWGWIDQFGKVLDGNKDKAAQWHTDMIDNYAESYQKGWIRYYSIKRDSYSDDSKQNFFFAFSPKNTSAVAIRSLISLIRQYKKEVFPPITKYYFDYITIKKTKSGGVDYNTVGELSNEFTYNNALNYLTATIESLAEIQSTPTKFKAVMEPKTND